MAKEKGKLKEQICKKMKHKEKLREEDAGEGEKVKEDRRTIRRRTS